MVVERQSGAGALAAFVEAGPNPELTARRLDVSREPYWRDAERELFLLRDSRRVLGRIAAIRRPDAPEQAAFGWLVAPQDPRAVKALVDAAAGWAQARNARRLVGPLNLGFGAELGALADGFTPAPSPLAPSNERWLPALLEQAGLQPVHTGHAYVVGEDDLPAPPYSLREAARDAGVDYRPLTHAQANDEAARFIGVYNAAHRGRFGAVPMSLETARARVREALVFGDRRLVWLAEVDGQPAGLVLALPLGEDGALTEAPSGQGTLGRLRAALRARRFARVHVAALAVAPERAGRGIEAQLLLRVWRAAIDLGADRLELGGMDAEAPETLALLWRLGAHRIRRYVVYQRELG